MTEQNDERLRPMRSSNVAIAIVLVAGPLFAAAGPGPTALRPPVCLLAGQVTVVDDSLRVDGPITRLIWPDSAGDSAGVEVELLGPTAQQVASASGRVLRQVGLRLRAQDPCNGIYVMWPLGQDAKVKVQVKRNEGMTTFGACGARGYTNVRPDAATSLAPLEPGHPRRLDAAVQGTRLTVRVDHRVVWSGDLGPEANGLLGDAGFRTDNVRVRLRAMDVPLWAPGHPAAAMRRPPPTCRRRL